MKILNSSATSHHTMHNLPLYQHEEVNGKVFDVNAMHWGNNNINELNQIQCEGEAKKIPLSLSNQIALLSEDAIAQASNSFTRNEHYFMLLGTYNLLQKVDADSSSVPNGYRQYAPSQSPFILNRCNLAHWRSNPTSAFPETAGFLDVSSGSSSDFVIQHNHDLHELNLNVSKDTSNKVLFNGATASLP